MSSQPRLSQCRPIPLLRICSWYFFLQHHISRPVIVGACKSSHIHRPFLHPCLSRVPAESRVVCASLLMRLQIGFELFFITSFTYTQLCIFRIANSFKSMRSTIQAMPVAYIGVIASYTQLYQILYIPGEISTTFHLRMRILYLFYRLHWLLLKQIYSSFSRPRNNVYISWSRKTFPHRPSVFAFHPISFLTLHLSVGAFSAKADQFFVT